MTIHIYVKKLEINAVTNTGMCYDLNAEPGTESFVNDVGMRKMDGVLYVWLIYLSNNKTSLSEPRAASDVSYFLSWPMVNMKKQSLLIYNSAKAL